MITNSPDEGGSGGSGGSGSSLKLPSMSSYTWRSSNSGNDAIHIDSSDENYCAQCEYLVAVYGYSNSTYTLLASDIEEAVIRLVPNRPQVAEIAARSNVLYFSALITSSVADITIALTPLNNGEADLYVQVSNAQHACDMYNATCTILKETVVDILLFCLGTRTHT